MNGRVVVIVCVPQVEDYIVGYMGEGRAAKEFLREFLEKRSETRARKLETDRDVSALFSS
jgi:hypothetical protein